MNQLEQYILVGYRVKPFTKSEKQQASILIGLLSSVNKFEKGLN